ncbi:unnamed protein product [Nezara viridula]|uniref:Coiled-coil-helix-coiled-coil-helix domain-containing protein 7 n=1 Tax=Nezara viridula TaxID=85310 RepID=A0A9P0HLN5_NEZVI|nr:unnamed protein product [Nezara viridula]
MDSNNQNSKESMKKHNWQLNNLENNPCFQEQNLSLKCIDDNNYDLDKCQLFFENYKNCKKFWNEVRRNRRFNGLTPALPPYAERIKIKEKFLKTGEL